MAQFLPAPHVLLKGAFAEGWEWEQGLERVEQSPWPGWQCWHGARSVWQPLQSQQGSGSRAWQAAEFEEEGDEGHDVKAGRCG